MPDIDFTDPVRLRAIITRPDAPLEGSTCGNDPIETSPHWWQIEQANETWLPFTGVFSSDSGKVTQPPAPPLTNSQEGPGTASAPLSWQTYTAVLEYLATGEGMRFQVLVTFAESEVAAKQAFLDRYYPGSPDLQNYFGRGVDVYPGVYRPALSPMLSEHYLAHLERTGQNSEFGLWRVFNLS